VKTNKNDYIDAEAIAEALTRPTMRFVPIKSDDQLVRGRTSLGGGLTGGLIVGAPFDLISLVAGPFPIASTGATKG